MNGVCVEEGQGQGQGGWNPVSDWTAGICLVVALKRWDYTAQQCQLFIKVRSPAFLPAPVRSAFSPAARMCLMILGMLGGVSGGKASGGLSGQRMCLAIT